jgi:TolB-like protein
MIDNVITESTQAEDVNKENINTQNTNSAGMSQGNFRFPAPKREEKPDERAFSGEALPNNINFYMRGLMQDLVSNLQYVNESTPIAVTSFVFLDGDFQKSSLLGNQMSESLIHEIHKVGIPVLDFKVTDYLRVTEQGDFISSRDHNELSTNIPIKYVVTGNLVKHQGGYLVNARVVGLSSKAVVGSAQSFIPAHVANALLNSASPQANPKVFPQVPLVQG